MAAPAAAIGLAVLVFFAVLWVVGLTAGISRVARSPGAGPLKRAGETFSAAGWLAVAATGLATLIIMLAGGWDYMAGHTPNATSAGTVGGFVWLFGYGAAAIILNSFGVRVYPPESGDAGAARSESPGGSP